MSSQAVIIVSSLADDLMLELVLKLTTGRVELEEEEERDKNRNQRMKERISQVKRDR